MNENASMPREFDAIIVVVAVYVRWKCVNVQNDDDEWWSLKLGRIRTRQQQQQQLKH